MSSLYCTLSSITTAYDSSEYNTTFALGLSFLSHIDGDTLDLVSMDDWKISAYNIVQEIAGSRDEGIKKVRDGKAWAYFNIPTNYSQSFVERCGSATVSNTIVSWVLPHRLYTVCESVENGTPPVDPNFAGAAVELYMDVTSE